MILPRIKALKAQMLIISSIELKIFLEEILLFKIAPKLNPFKLKLARKYFKQLLTPVIRTIDK